MEGGFSTLLMVVAFFLLASVAVLVLLLGLLVVLFFLDVDRHGHLHGVGHLFVHGHAHLLVDWVGLVHWVLYLEGHLLLYLIGHLLDDLIRLGHWYLDVHWVGLLNFDLVGPVDWNLDFIRHWLIYGDGVWLLHVDGVRFGHVYVVGPVYWDLNLIRDLLDDFVRLGHLDFNLDWVRDFLLNGVGLWHGHLDFIGYFLLYCVGLGNVYLDFVRLVNRNLDFIRDLLLYGVGFWHVHWDLDVFLNGVRYLLLYCVWLRVGDLDFIGHFLLDGVWDVLLDGVGDVDLLDDLDMLDMLVSSVSIGRPSRDGLPSSPRVLSYRVPSVTASIAPGAAPEADAMSASEAMSEVIDPSLVLLLVISHCFYLLLLGFCGAFLLFGKGHHGQSGHQ